MYSKLYNMPQVEPQLIFQIYPSYLWCKQVMVSVHYLTRAKGKDLKKKGGGGGKKKKTYEFFGRVRGCNKTSNHMYKMHSSQLLLLSCI